MKRVDVVITIDSNSRDLEYFVMEGIDLETNRYFRLVNGEWIGKFPNFPIESDNDLDILMIVRGQPGTDSIMKVKIDNREPTTNRLFRPFNRNGYAQFNEQIPV